MLVKVAWDGISYEVKKYKEITSIEKLLCHPNPELSNPTNDEYVRVHVQATILHCTGMFREMDTHIGGTTNVFTTDRSFDAAIDLGKKVTRFEFEVV